MPSLKITPIPFRSSNLAVPPSPFSPRSPLTPIPQPKKPGYAERRDSVISAPPPVVPLQWMWQCHQCRQTYPLGVTRRCLEDGHNFCAGTTITRSRKASHRKIVKKHRACASEFDYAAWKTIGNWRRDCLTPTTPARKGKKDCWHNCDYPSECRWGNKLVQLQVSPVAPAPAPSVLPKVEIVQKETPPTTFEHILQAINHRSPVGKRTRKTQKSPLALDIVIEEEIEDADGDIAMADAVSSPSPAVKASGGRSGGTKCGVVCADTKGITADVFYYDYERLQLQRGRR